MNELEISLPSQYTPMLAKIDDVLPLANLDTENFNKSSSQFKTAILDIVDLTPINAAKHLLAVIQRTRLALEETSIKLRRKKLELARKEIDLFGSTETSKEDLLIDIDEIKLQISSMEAAGRGAVRKLANALDQYQGILESLGKDHLTEIDYEEDQTKYHIMTAFNQALTAARARGGLIDEGNHIYLFQLGINGATAQREVTAFLNAEQKSISEGFEPSHDAIIQWLNLLAEKYYAYPSQYAQKRYLKIINENLLLENTR